MTDSPQLTIPKTNDVQYVAFCDILGFSDKILTDFDQTLKVYSEFAKLLAGFEFQGVQVTIYSDSILIAGKAFAAVLSAAQTLWFFALAHDLMIRGAITKGRYWELKQGNSLLVASDALVRAVQMEKSVGVPAIVVADDIEIPDDHWISRFAKGPLLTPLLHFRDRNIVNPFNMVWYRSAATRAAQLMALSPQHKDKYLWFLSLHQAVGENRELVPPAVLARFIDLGIQ